MTEHPKTTLLWLTTSGIKIVSNCSKEWSRSVLDIAIFCREDVDRVMDVLSQNCKVRHYE